MVCDNCEREMTTADGCIAVPVSVNGEELDPVEWDGESRCHDCGAMPGGYHHPGCDMERCPSCGGQLIGCGCLD
jgi:hypothetical protein